MTVTRTFQSGNSVAVRLPKALGVGPGVEMKVERYRDGVTILPTSKQASGAALVAALRALPPLDDPWSYEKAIIPVRPELARWLGEADDE